MRRSVICRNPPKRFDARWTGFNRNSFTLFGLSDRRRITPAFFGYHRHFAELPQQQIGETHGTPAVNYYDPELPQRSDILYGDYQSISSEFPIQREYLAIDQITSQSPQVNHANDLVWVRGRVSSVRVKGNACFLVLRSNHSSTIQITYFKDKKNPIESKKLIKFVESLPVESIVDVQGMILLAKVHSCTQSDVEINLQKIFIIINL